MNVSDENGETIRRRLLIPTPTPEEAVAERAFEQWHDGRRDEYDHATWEDFVNCGCSYYCIHAIAHMDALNDARKKWEAHGRPGLEALKAADKAAKLDQARETTRARWLLCGLSVAAVSGCLLIALVG
jgi:hypothetical protein